MLTPSPRALAAMTAENSGETWVDLLTLTHPDLATPIRLTNDKTHLLGVENGTRLYGTRSKGAGRVGPDAAAAEHVFSWLPFDLNWPGYEEGAIPKIAFTIDMIDRQKILAVLRTPREGKVKCLIESVLAAEPDYVNFQFRGFYLDAAPWNDVSAQLELSLSRYDVEPYPVGVCTPQVAPGLFP